MMEFFYAENNTLYVNNSEDTAYAIDANTGLARDSRFIIIPKQSVTLLPVYLSNVPKDSCTFGIECKITLTPACRCQMHCWHQRTTKHLFKWSIHKKRLFLKPTTVIASATIVDPATDGCFGNQHNTIPYQPINFDLNLADLTGEQKQLLLQCNIP